MKREAIIFRVLLGLFFAAQLGFWYNTRVIKPDMEIVPDVPSAVTVKALSFGDEQFFFRILALHIQNAGDTYGRFTALNKYDYKKLYRWLKLLDGLDNVSNMMPNLASYYYSQTQNTPDVRYMVDYLYEHSYWRPEKKWWWLVQAIYLANHKLKDRDLALKIATPLTETHTIPLWAQQMPAFIYEQRGEMEEAYKIIENITANVKDIPENEQKFMHYFVEERLKKLEDMEKKEQK